VIDCPDPRRSGKSTLSAIAKTGIELKFRAMVTVRTSLVAESQRETEVLPTQVRVPHLLAAQEAPENASAAGLRIGPLAACSGKRLLRRGSVRLKPTEGRGGCGQLVIADLSSLRRALDALDPRKLAEDGIVLEEHLSEVATFSVGEIRVAGTILSYLGLQRLTTDNAGQAVYGGSDLEFVRGSLDELAASALSSQARLAVERARAYDRAAAKYYPAIVASRRNYDVAVGVDGAGRHVLGVLEQSWRIGGASPAEVLALEQFGRQPSLKTVRAATVEVYGEPAAVPADAMLFYHGEDAEAGPITKYARILGDGNGEQQS
jgi:hypothetical protein